MYVLWEEIRVRTIHPQKIGGNMEDYIYFECDSCGTPYKMQGNPESCRSISTTCDDPECEAYICVMYIGCLIMETGLIWRGDDKPN